MDELDGMIDEDVNTTRRHSKYCREVAKDGRMCSLYYPHDGKHKPRHGIESDRFETGE